MISYLKGKIILKREAFIILEVNGVGFKVFVSDKSISKIPSKGDNLKLFTFMNVGENRMELYGFLEYQEFELFEVLESISGVGPKAALQISSFGPLEKLKKQMKEKGIEVFTKIKGIGKKKAQKIMLELSDKISEVLKNKQKTKEANQKDQKAVEALINLGFSKKEAQNALSKVPEETKSTENKVKKALEILGK